MCDITNQPPTVAGGERLPAAFLARMEKLLGGEMAEFLAAYQKPAAPTLRVNTAAMSVEDARQIAPFMGEPVPWQPAGAYYGDAAREGDIRPGKHPLHEAGLYYIQEASAMLPGSLCPPLPGERVLDLCAAPGGKATQLAAALAGEGLLVANEISPGRAAILSQNMERMGVHNALVTNVSPEELAKHFPNFFDKIVVDAPCSGEGMFRKEPDAVRMWSPENVAFCAERQANILDAAALMLRPGGYLTYSTCTFAPEENEGSVAAFLHRHPDFEVVPSREPAVIAARAAGILDGGNSSWTTENCEGLNIESTYRILPHHADGEGHFAALLHRREEGQSPFPAPAVQRRNRKPDKRRDAENKAAFALFEAFAKEVFGGLPAWVEGTVPCLFGTWLYLVPRDPGDEIGDAADICRLRENLHILRAGVCVGHIAGAERGRGRLEPDHALAMLKGVESGQSFPLESEEDATAYLRGETLPAPGRRGWHIVTYKGLPLGWGKASDGVMKNHYPKGLRWN